MPDLENLSRKEACDLRFFNRAALHASTFDQRSSGVAPEMWIRFSGATTLVTRTVSPDLDPPRDR
jgi:hypothetical protein